MANPMQASSRKLKVLAVFGTRPEAIKLAPVLRAMRDDKRFEPHVCVTAQHRGMLDQVLTFFQIEPDFDLDLMQPDQSLYELSASALQGLERVLTRVQPDWVLVQGDTTTTLMGALAAFYARIPVAHLEAGLRTQDKYAPFPEEINRRLTSHIADLHFAPTGSARENLLREGIEDVRIVVSGNTVIDALLWAREKVRQAPSVVDRGVLQRFSDPLRRLVLVTAHRREAFGSGLHAICLALKELAQAHPEVDFVWPVHRNPNVREPVMQLLGPRDAGQPNVVLLDPVDYPTLVWLLERCHLALTDSGGIQEEAPALGKPVLVMRAVTERHEGIEAGTARLVGMQQEYITRSVTELLSNMEAYRRMSRAANPYGNGHSAECVLATLANFITSSNHAIQK